MDSTRAVLFFLLAFLRAATLSSAAPGMIGLGDSRVGGGMSGFPPFVNGQLPGGLLEKNAGALASVLQAMAGSGARPTPRSVYSEGNITTEVCDPPCSPRQCCLLKPNEKKPSCQSFQFHSGKKCFWHHCTQDHTYLPTAKAIYGRGCPCNIGMCCLGNKNSGTFSGACTFL